MTGRYAALASRIRQDLDHVEQTVERAELAVEAAVLRPEDQDLYLDSAALNLHDLYSGVERLLLRVAEGVDGSVVTIYPAKS